MKSFLLNRHNFFIGFIIAILVTASILPFVKVGSKYKLSIIKNIKQRNGYIDMYKDLYNNGNSIRFHIVKNFEGNSAIILVKSGRTLLEWNLHGKLLSYKFLVTGDYNKDGVDEIYAFSYSHDSIFLSGYDIVTDEICFPPLFLRKFKYYNHQCDITIWDAKLHRFSPNGPLKLVVPIHSGFSKSSRRLYIIDLKTHSFIMSPLAATEEEDEINFVNLRKNGSEDITGEMYAAGNFPKSYTLSDQFLWFFVYDSSLHYLFKPVKLGHHPGCVHVYPFRTKSSNLLAVFASSNLLTDSSFIGIANSKGHFLKYRKLPYDNNGNGYFLKVLPFGRKTRMLLYHSDNGLVEYLDKNLRTIKTYQSAPYKSYIYQFDLDGDGKKENVYFGKDPDHLIVSRYNFKYPTILKISGEFDIPYFSERWENGKPKALCLSLPHRYYEFKYTKNPIYTLRFLIYGGIFILIFFFVNIIGFYYQRLLKIRYSAAKRIHDNQLRSIEMQLNPHFILNTLNSIGALYEKKETQSARIYMGKYSKLLRNTLLSSGKIATTLKDELDFVKNFLDLEQFRHDNRFTYFISCRSEFESIQLPRLLVHTFVENAIKHGLYPILGKQPAFLEIKCSENKRFWIIEISDNGIGKEAAKEKETFSTGKGLQILNETLSLYRSVYHQSIKYNMTDLTPGTEFPGTKVTILIRKQTHKRKK